MSAFQCFNPRSLASERQRNSAGFGLGVSIRARSRASDTRSCTTCELTQFQSALARERATAIAVFRSRLVVRFNPRSLASERPRSSRRSRAFQSALARERATAMVFDRSQYGFNPRSLASERPRPITASIRARSRASDFSWECGTGFNPRSLASERRPLHKLLPLIVKTVPFREGPQSFAFGSCLTMINDVKEPALQAYKGGRELIAGSLRALGSRGNPLSRQSAGLQDRKRPWRRGVPPADSNRVPNDRCEGCQSRDR